MFQIPDVKDIAITSCIILSVLALILTVNDPNNIEGDLTAEGNIFQGETYHAYGGFQNATQTIAITADIWSNLTNSTHNLYTEVQGDGIIIINDSILIYNKADYSGILSFTFEGVNTKDYIFRVINVDTGEQKGYQIGATGLGPGNYVNAAIPLYIEAEANERFIFQVSQDAGNDLTAINSIFTINYLHD